MIVHGKEIQKVVFLSYLPIATELGEDPRRKLRNSVERALDDLGFLVLSHDQFLSYEKIPMLIAMSDISICFWDKWFTSSTWKLIEIEESTKTLHRSISPINRSGNRPLPVIVLKLDSSREMSFNQSYENQIGWLDHFDPLSIAQRVTQLIGLNGSDDLPYLQESMIKN